MSPRRRELARADRILPGLWRLRLPLPWPGRAARDAFAISARHGVVLVDTGLHQPGALRQLEHGLGQAGLRLEHVRLLVSRTPTPTTTARPRPIADGGCELWMHPNHEHMTRGAGPRAGAERRLEVARERRAADAARPLRGERRAQGFGIAELVMPERDLVPGVEVDTDLGTWQVHETPGHAPSHVVLHQAERGLPAVR